MSESDAYLAISICIFGVAFALLAAWRVSKLGGPFKPKLNEFSSVAESACVGVAAAFFLLAAWITLQLPAA